MHIYVYVYTQGTDNHALRIVSRLYLPHNVKAVGKGVKGLQTE